MAARAKKTPVSEPGFSEIINRFKAHPFLYSGTIIVLVIVIIAFVFVPAIPDVMGNQDGGLTFGYYNNKPIGHSYNNYFDRTLREMAYYSGFELQSDYSKNSYAAYQVWYAAFTRTLIRTALLEEMRASGYTAPPKEIDRRVAELPDFQEDGRFSYVKYNNFDKARLLSVWNNIEGDFIATKYMNSLNGLHTSSGEKAFMAAMASPERTFDMVSFPRSAYPDSELLVFAEENPAIFKINHLSRLTLESEKEALQILESITGGKTSFEDAARNHSVDLDKEKGGDMGLRMTWEYYSEIAEEEDRDAVFTLKQDELSKVIKAPGDRWVIFRMQEEPYDPDLSLDENIAKVRSYMTRFEGGRMENWLVARVEELIAESKQQNRSVSDQVEFIKARTGETALSAVAAAATTGSIGPTPLNYDNLGGEQNEQNVRLFTNTLDTRSRPELNSAVSNDNFWRTAFSIPLNEPSAPFTLGETIVVLTATEETVLDEESNNNIMDFYTKGWMMNSMDNELSSAVLSSPKLENNFMDVFFPLLTSREEEPSTDE